MDARTDRSTRRPGRAAGSSLTPGTFAVVSAQAARDRRLGKGGALRVLVELARHADRTTRETFVSTARVARNLGIGPRAAQQHLKRLVDAGYVEIAWRRSGGVPRRHLRLTYPAVGGVQGGTATM